MLYFLSWLWYFIIIQERIGFIPIVNFKINHAKNVSCILIYLRILDNNLIYKKLERYLKKNIFFNFYYVREYIKSE